MRILDSRSSACGFPPPSEATEDGLIAVGGDLSCERLLDAYKNGIFPWYGPEGPILWWHPRKRLVMYPDDLKVSRSLRKSISNKGFTTTYDQCFRQVVEYCATAKRQERYTGTWITNSMSRAYNELHKKGFAHSIEIWLNSKLVGGLYGVAIGSMFFGESMFSLERDSSKVALYHLTQLLKQWDYVLIDCQVPSDHLISLGAKLLEREKFMAILKQALKKEQSPKAWKFTNQQFSF